jgi:hypothetical protein
VLFDFVVRDTGKEAIEAEAFIDGMWLPQAQCAYQTV